MLLNRCILIGMICVGLASLSPAQVRPVPYDAAQKQSHQQLLAAIAELEKAEQAIPAQTLRDINQGAYHLGTLKLKALAGDPSPGVEQIKDEEMFAAYYTMNYFMVAAETKLRLGDSAQGNQLLTQALQAAAKAYRTGYTTGSTFRVAGNVLARMGGVNELNQMIGALPKGGGTPGSIQAELGYFLVATFLEEQQLDKASQFASQIPEGYYTGESRERAFHAIAQYLQRSGDKQGAASAYATEILTVDSHPESPQKANEVVSQLAKLDAWKLIDELLGKLDRTRVASPNALRVHVITLMLEQGKRDNARRIAAAMEPDTPQSGTLSPTVAAWLAFAKAYSEPSDAPQRAQAIQSAKQAAQAIGVTNAKMSWGEVVQRYEQSVADTIQIARFQNGLNNKAEARKTLEEVATLIRGGPPAPVEYQVAQGGNESGRVRERDMMLLSLATELNALGDTDGMRKTLNEVKDISMRNSFEQRSKTAAAQTPRPSASGGQGMSTSDAETNALVENLKNGGDLEAVFDRVLQSRNSPGLPRWAEIVAEGAARRRNTDLMFKALQLSPNIDRKALASIGVLCTSNRDNAAAQKLLDQMKTAPQRKEPWQGVELVYGDARWLEIELLLRARLNDQTVVREINQRMSAAGKDKSAEQLSRELACIAAIAGADVKDLPWLAKLTGEQRVWAFIGLAEGYVERMSQMATERRHFEYHQSGF